MGWLGWFFGERGRVVVVGVRDGRTSDSPADQRRSMSANVRGAARTWREVARERRARAVGTKCIFGCWFES